MKKLGFRVSLSNGRQWGVWQFGNGFLRGRFEITWVVDHVVRRTITWVADYPDPGSRWSCAGASDPADTDSHSRRYSNSSRKPPLFHNLRTIVSFSFRLNHALVTN